MSDLSTNYAESTGKAHGMLSMLPFRLNRVLALLDTKDTDSAKLEIVQSIADIENTLGELEDLANRRDTIYRNQMREISDLLARNPWIQRDKKD